MRYFSLALALLLGGFLWPSIGHGQGCGPTNPNCVGPTPPVGDVSSRFATTAFVLNTTINVMAYGAVCDGSTDDATAINTALTATRAVAAAPFFQGIRVVFPPNRRCLFRSTLNMTGQAYLNAAAGAFGLQSVVIEGAGSVLECFTTGTACIDAMGSARMTFSNINLYGNDSGAGQIPNVGIQIGRTAFNVPVAGVAYSTDSFRFDNVVITGRFSFTAFYDMASESNLYNNLRIFNLNTGNSYAMVIDGYNHWACDPVTPVQPCITTLAIIGTPAIPIPKDQPLSSQQGHFNRASIQGAGTGTGATAWISGTSSLEFTNTYMSAQGASCTVQLYYVEADKFRNNTRIVFDAHFEAVPNTNTFCFTAAATPPLAITQKGFKYINENANSATNAILRIDPASGITSVTIQDLQLEVSCANDTSACTSLAPNVTVFDDGSAHDNSPSTKWNATGKVTVTNPTIWSKKPPATFSGVLCIEANTTCDVYSVASTVGTLPTCTAMLNGVTRSVTDQVAGSIAYNAAPTGGGLVKRTVICDSTIPGWRLN